jgi:uncharacterized protein (TIGR02996 family)
MVPALDELIQREPDPRLGHLAVTWIEEQIQRDAFNDKLWRRLANLLIATGDPSTLAPLKRIPEALEINSWMKHRIEERLPRALERIAENIPETEPLTVDAASRCAELAIVVETAALDPALDARPPDTAAGAQLLRAVFDNPHDDGLRLVLADALTEAGDPRGELITLQLGRLGGRGTRKSKARERALIREHVATWIGGLSRITYKRSLRFHRGFLVSCALKPMKAARALAEADHPEWATVERIEFSQATAGWGSVVSPQMRSCRALIGICKQGLQALIESCPHLPVEHLAVAYEVSLRGLVKHLCATEGLAQLRTLSVFWDHRDESVLDPLWESAVGQRLETLVLKHAPHDHWHGGPLPVKRIAIETHGGWAVTVLAGGESDHFVPAGDDVPWEVPVEGICG